MVLSGFFAAVGLEAALRMTPLRSHLSAHYPLRFHYKADPEAGHDIDPRGPAFYHYMPHEQYSYPLWSNNLGCFDEPYGGEHEYALLVGDSFTEGFTRFDKKWGTILEQALGYRILKCGVGAYGTHQELLKARKIIDTIGSPPQLIVVGYYMNDLEDDYLFPALTASHGYLVTARQVVDRTTGRIGTKRVSSDEIERWERFCETPGTPPERFAWIRCFLRRESILFNAAKRLRPTSTGPSAPVERTQESYHLAFQSPERYEWVRAAWDTHLNNLREFHELAQRAGSKLVIVVIPTPEQVSPGLLRGPDIDLELPNRILREFFERERIDYIDLLPVFRRAALGSVSTTRGPLYWPNDGHLNEDGNQLTGFVVARYVLDSRLLIVSKPTEKTRQIDAMFKSLEGF